MKRLLFILALLIGFSCSESPGLTTYQVTVIDNTALNWHTIDINGQKYNDIEFDYGIIVDALEGDLLNIKILSEFATVKHSITVSYDCFLVLYFEGGEFIFIEY
jgi:hypothetical protein